MNSYKIDLTEIDIPTIELPDFYVPEIDIPTIELPDFYIPEIDVPTIELPDFYIPEIDDVPTIELSDFYVPKIELPKFPTKNAIILEVNNTIDTNVIDANDGLSLGEAIEIANNDLDNNYVIEVPGGSTYTATIDENSSRIITFRRIGEGSADITINSSNSFRSMNFTGESIVTFNNSGINIPEINIPEINIPNFPIDNSTILEVNNTIDTNVIDESDGLSLGEAIEIANDDLANNYVIETPGGSTYTATIEENLSKPVAFRGTGEGSANITITSSNSVNQVNLVDGSLFVLGDSGNEALELNSETVQIAYVAYYGRPAENGGLDFWQNVFADNDVSYAPRKGDSLTGVEKDIYNQIVNDFGKSDEANRLFGDLDNNRDKVNRVYQLAFDRDAQDAGLDYWTDQLDQGNITLSEMSLEVALGAQNEDIVILNNKIESANLFSQSIDTEDEITAYSGSSAEVFGQDWLNDFGNTVSSQEQVDAALSNLVDGNF